MAFLHVGVVALSPVGLSALERWRWRAAASNTGTVRRILGFNFRLFGGGGGGVGGGLYGGGFCVVGEVVSQNSEAPSHHDCWFCAHGSRKTCSVGEMVSAKVAGPGHCGTTGWHPWVLCFMGLSGGSRFTA